VAAGRARTAAGLAGGLTSVGVDDMRADPTDVLPADRHPAGGLDAEFRSGQTPVGWELGTAAAAQRAPVSEVTPGVRVMRDRARGTRSAESGAGSGGRPAAVPGRLHRLPRSYGTHGAGFVALLIMVLRTVISIGPDL